ncbi:MAG: patatin-like phospholipase family protein [Proteobacteria bacterium]|nr:patatin-like phospholipase family protein [Pseudomonadota bacterium]
MTKLGLVLAGGGGKGSYEIGVWKYLREIGLDSQISVISGTSVGGLNAFLIGYGDYELAERLWLTEVEDRILDTESQSHRNDAVFSREGLLQIIDENIRFDRTQQMPKIFVTCYNSTEKQADYIKLNDLKDTEIKHYLLATSAIPVVFQKESINGNAYYDGGLTDNVPLRPLLDEGCTHAIIVSLDNRNKNDYSGYDIKTVLIRPSCNLGSFVKGTLDFTSKRAQIRIQLGYEDCKNIYALSIKGLTQNNVEGVEKVTEAEAISKMQRIHEMNEKAVLLEALKRISAEPILAGIVSVNMNAEIGTQGGKVFWTDLAEYNGWRWQQNKVFGQVRLLDPLNNRKAWGNYQKVVQKCRDFLANEVRRENESSKNSDA